MLESRHVLQARNLTYRQSIRRTMPQVMVLSSEGYFYSYNIDLENGGECSLMKQYRCVPLPPSVYPSLFVHILMVDPHPPSLLDSNDETND